MKTIDIGSLFRNNIKNLKPYTSARDEFKEITGDFIFLDANENPFDTGFNRYPDPQQRKLKKVFSELKRVNEDQILFGNGSDEVLDLIIRAFCEPGIDNVLGISPSYGMYEVLANINNVEYKKSLLNSLDYSLNLNDIFAQINDNTKLVFLCSPNNPTGQILNFDDVKRVVEGFDGIVIIDEAYIDFSTEKSWLKMLSQYNNIIVTQTLSKAFGLAGIRLGIAYASAQIIAGLNKIKPPYNINQLTQEKALSVMIDKSYSNNLNTCNSIEKNLLYKALVKLNFVLKVYPSDSNFILIKVTNANEIYDKILKKGIVVRNRTKDDLCENCLRISIGTPDQNRILIDVLKSISESE